MKVDWAATAFIFPGQGSQTLGMGQDIAAAYPVSKAVFDQSDRLLGLPFSHLMWQGPEDELNDTMNTQPALYVCSMAILRALQQALPDARPAAVAGHSLGELTALSAAEALGFDAGPRLVRERGRLMKEAGDSAPGAMAAVLGADANAVNTLCARASALTGKPLVLANDNCPGQIVISGDSETVDRAIEMAREVGARRAVRLAVSIAPHSPLMASAEADFARSVAATHFDLPNIPVYGNISTQPLTSISAIREELDAQLTSPVYWTDLVRNMIAAGIHTFVEIGSKNVLTGLLKRIDADSTGISIEDMNGLESFVEANR